VIAGGLLVTGALFSFSMTRDPISGEEITAVPMRGMA
jgi:hypothetical protein